MRTPPTRIFKRRFEYFEVDERPGDSGVEILEQLNLSSDQRTTTYLVRYLCCDDEVQMAHKSIAARMKRENKECRTCRFHLVVEASRIARTGNPSASKRPITKAVTKADLLADYGVTPPAWAVPRPSLIGAHVPFNDRAAA